MTCTCGCGHGVGHGHHEPHCGEVRCVACGTPIDDAEECVNGMHLNCWQEHAADYEKWLDTQPKIGGM